MKINKKKLSIIKAKNIISIRDKKEFIIPKDDPDNLQLFMNDSSKKLKKEKSQNNVREDIKKIVLDFLADIKENFDSDFKHYFHTIDDNNYQIKFTIKNFNKEYLFLNCSETKCKAKGKISLINNFELGLPDPDGNILSSKNNQSIFTCDMHTIPIELHNSYIKDFIKNYFINLTRKEIFKDIDKKHIQ